jgi:NH3-dependent NAD+ synthetase
MKKNLDEELIEVTIPALVELIKELSIDYKHINFKPIVENFINCLEDQRNSFEIDNYNEYIIEKERSWVK